MQEAPHLGGLRCSSHNYDLTRWVGKVESLLHIVLQGPRLLTSSALDVQGLGELITSSRAGEG